MELLKRKYCFSSFEEAISFIDQVAPIFSRENHHPQITNFYNLIKQYSNGTRPQDCE